MRINNSNPYNYNQKTNVQATKNPNFKGYFACPLKEIHMHPISDFEKIVPELYKKCGDLFDIIIKTTSDIINYNKVQPENVVHGKLPTWAQDYKVFLEDNTIGSLYSIAERDTLALSEKLKMKVHKISSKLPGGNFFMGKNHQGEKILLIGEEELLYKNTNVLSKDFRVNPKNIFTIPQPDFHIDLKVRPLDYPSVLVGDEEMLFEALMESKAADSPDFRKVLYSIYQEGEKYKRREGYKSTEEIVNRLESQGFKTIRVPGLLGKNDLNFMNALVHQKPNGDLVYITGKSTLFEKEGVDLNKTFEDTLKKFAPQVKEVIFMESKAFPKEQTLIEHAIKNFDGGLHCMCCERPDFEKWNKMITTKAPR